MKQSTTAFFLALSVLAASLPAAANPHNDPSGMGASRGRHLGTGSTTTATSVMPGRHLGVTAGNRGRHVGQLRRLQTATLPQSTILYALQHQSAQIARLRAMRTIDYSRIRIVRVPASIKARLHVSLAPFDVAYGDNAPMLDAPYQTAQIFGGGSGLIGELETLAAGIMVSNAINRATGGYGGGTGATLAQVLLNSGIPLSDLLGVVFSGGGILNALVG